VLFYPEEDFVRATTAGKKGDLPDGSFWLTFKRFKTETHHHPWSQGWSYVLLVGFGWVAPRVRVRVRVRVRSLLFNF